MKEKILRKLKEIEESRNITILYAVETGSRAWGHANENSDYDVRFIYKHNDIVEYLVLDKFEDVIQLEEGDFDFAGWDVKKALQLHYKSNPNLREWLISPVVYLPDETGIFEGFEDFSPEILRNYYFGLTNKTYKKYIRGNDFRDVKIVKKTLYVIRCTLAWKLLDKGIMPQMDFNEILEKSEVSDELKNAIMSLRTAYSTLTIGEVDDDEFEMIHSWIEESFGEFTNKPFKASKRNIEDYNERFFEIIGLR